MRPGTRHSRATSLLIAGLLTIGFLSCPVHAEDKLKIIQQPTFWIVGQWTRIMVQTPPDCGKLEVTHPEELKLLGRWPHKAGDKVQRFYFRALEPFHEGKIVLTCDPYALEMPVRVMSWQEVLTERFEREITPGWSWTGTLKLPRRFPMDGEDERKSGLGYLSAEELESQRAEFSKNLRGHAAQAVPQAEDLGKLFYSLPGCELPRAVYVNNPVYRPQDKVPGKGCPVCGLNIFEGRSPFYPWVLDREKHPLKVQCPECERWFPSNDFAAGDMTSGEFPDDGWGYFDEKGRPYAFVGYYLLQNYRGGERRTELYSRLYLASGDKRLARAAVVLLFRVAEQYLNLSLNINQRERYTRDNLWRGAIPPQGTPPPSHASWFAPGFYLDAIWSIGLERFYGEAFERIWDYLQEEDPVLLEFLRDNHHPEVKSMQDVRHFIETGYFRTVAQGLLDHSLNGNGPAEQAMALRVARILNTPRAIDLVDWAFNNPRHGVRYYLPNSFFKDGSGYESPGYNNAHYGGTAGIADLLSRVVELRPDQYAKAKFPLLTEDPKFKAMYDHNINLTLISRTYANVGDDGDLPYTDPLPLNPGASLLGGGFIRAFERWPEVNYAKALWDAKTNAPIKLLRDPALRAKVTEIVEREGPYLELPSQVLDGFGHVILRSGKADDQRALWMRYGKMYGHGHHDGLTIGYEALKRTLLPEQGYNRGPDYRTEWDMNWTHHYCGRVVGVKGEPRDSWGRQARGEGRLRLFTDGGWAQMATAARRHYLDAEPPELTTLTDDPLVERTVALVDLGPKHSYVVSIFRLGGGTDHYLSFHGPRGTAEVTGLKLTPQAEGTLAGPEIPYGQKWDSVFGKENPHLMMFSFLYDVGRAKPEAPWGVRWDLEKYPDVHLRLHSVGTEGGEVALCKGKPPGGGKPYELQWVMRHTQGAEPLVTQFVEVLEAYEGDPLITEVRPLTAETEDAGAQRPVAFQVVCGNRVDTIIHSQSPEARVTTSNGVAMTGAFAVWSEEGGKVKRAFLAAGTELTKGTSTYAAESGACEANIVSADFAKNAIVASPAPPEVEKLAGRYVRITNSCGNDATHLIVAARAVETGVELTLEWDPRIGEGPVKEVHEDGVTSAVTLKFGGLYYRGKTLSNEANSATYKINGVLKSRAYLNRGGHPEVGTEALRRDFVDSDGDGIPRFLIYDYGPGDTVTVPTVVSVGSVK